MIDSGTKCLILAGGASSRMGTDKRYLKTSDTENRNNLLQLMIGVCREVFSDVVLLVDDQFSETSESVDAVIHRDCHLYQGPLTALTLYPEPAEWNFVLAVDMPNVTQDVIFGLLEVAHESKGIAIVPKANKQMQPLSALYHADMWEQFRDCIATGERSLMRALGKHLNVIEFVGPSRLGLEARMWDNVFMNLNTPEDVQRWRNNNPSTS